MFGVLRIAIPALLVALSVLGHARETPGNVPVSLIDFEIDSSSSRFSVLKKMEGEGSLDIVVEETDKWGRKRYAEYGLNCHAALPITVRSNAPTLDDLYAHKKRPVLEGPCFSPFWNDLMTVVCPAYGLPFTPFDVLSRCPTYPTKPGEEIPEMLKHFRIHDAPELESKYFRVIRKKPDGDWMILTLERQDEGNALQNNQALWDILVSRIRLNCKRKEVIIQQDFRIDFQQLLTHPSSTANSFDALTPLWKKITEKVCAAYCE